MIAPAYQHVATTMRDRRSVPRDSKMMPRTTNAGGHQLVHVQGHSSYPRRQNGEACPGEPGRARLEAEFCRDLGARVRSDGGSEEDDPECLPDCLTVLNTCVCMHVSAIVFTEKSETGQP
ncbi:E2F transcription factor-like E2FE [Zea mays]|jgi:hypothetical protein|uniref:E2F transcription factor-like E2FE n=1 Tax=Zea mays TaxID=4577 RepID=A0A1D6GMQ6_MAIZE|nr:E2F transcription factor-like E2FE [Zea mays]